MPAEFDALIKKLKAQFRKAHPKWTEKQISDAAFGSATKIFKQRNKSTKESTKSLVFAHIEEIKSKGKETHFIASFTATTLDSGDQGTQGYSDMITDSCMDDLIAQINGTSGNAVFPSYTLSGGVEHEQVFHNQDILPVSHAIKAWRKGAVGKMEGVFEHTPGALQTIEMCKSRVLKGISIEYKSIAHTFKRMGNKMYRVISKAALTGYTHTAKPMQKFALLDGVFIKSLGEVETMKEQIVEGILSSVQSGMATVEEAKSAIMNELGDNPNLAGDPPASDISADAKVSGEETTSMTEEKTKKEETKKEETTAPSETPAPKTTEDNPSEKEEKPSEETEKTEKSEEKETPSEASEEIKSLAENINKLVEETKSLQETNKKLTAEIEQVKSQLADNKILQEKAEEVKSALDKIEPEDKSLAEKEEQTKFDKAEETGTTYPKKLELNV